MGDGDESGFSRRGPWGNAGEMPTFCGVDEGDPKPADQMVKVRIKALGICGSDVHHFKWKYGNVLAHEMCQFRSEKAYVIGHELCRNHRRSGSQVKSLVVGDRVASGAWDKAAENVISANKAATISGPKMKIFFGVSSTNGSLANQVVHPADLCYKLPDNVSFWKKAMCEPLSVGVHACRRAGIGPGTRILILEQAPLALMWRRKWEQIRQKSGGIVDVSFRLCWLQQDHGNQPCKPLALVGRFASLD
nr:L-idonate 5-dehydrogenase [Ipomoea batatas]